MMATSFLRVFSPGALLLLLAMTTTTMQRAGATTTSDLTPTYDGTTSASTGVSGSDATTTDATTTDATTTDATTTGSGSDATPTDGTTTTTGSDASPTSDATDEDEECATEAAACAADADCLSCTSVTSTSESEYLACSEEITANGDFDSSTEYCTGVLAGLCCIEELSDVVCVENEAFAEWALCTGGDCTGDPRTCEDIESGVTASDSDGATASLGGSLTVLAFSCAFMVLLPFLWA